MADLVEYESDSGHCAFVSWREGLDASVRARVTVSVLRLGEGNFSSVKGVGFGVFELRTDFGPGFRVYFGKDGERLIILLGGGTKRRQQTDIERRNSFGRSTNETRSGGRTTMGHLKSFRESVRGDLERDAAFRQSLLGEAVSCMVSGDIQTGKVVLREYVNGTVGFTKLGEAMGRSPKSLMRMLGPQGNPAARNLFQMIAYLQQAEGLVLEVRATPLAAA